MTSRYRIDEETSGVGVGPLSLDVEMARELGWNEADMDAALDAFHEFTRARKSPVRSILRNLHGLIAKLCIVRVFVLGVIAFMTESWGQGAACAFIAIAVQVMRIGDLLEARA